MHTPNSNNDTNIAGTTRKEKAKANKLTWCKRVSLPRQLCVSACISLLCASLLLFFPPLSLVRSMPLCVSCLICTSLLSLPEEYLDVLLLPSARTDMLIPGSMSSTVLASSIWFHFVSAASKLPFRSLSFNNCLNYASISSLCLASLFCLTASNCNRPISCGFCCPPLSSSSSLFLQ